MASLVASEELLSAVRYPDESTGLPGAGDAFAVRYAYNRLGELRATTDQNGTRHEYQRDAAGRVTRDSVGALGAGIDGAVRAITVSYDAAGRMREVRTAADELGANSSSGVGFTYTPLWQVASVVQHPTGSAFATNGTPAAGSRSVSYAYATVLPSTAATPPATGDNFSRLSTTTYPSTSTLGKHGGHPDLRLGHRRAVEPRLGPLAQLPERDEVLARRVPQARHGHLRGGRLPGGRHPARPHLESIRPEAPHERLVRG